MLTINTKEMKPEHVSALKRLRAELKEALIENNRKFAVSKSNKDKMEFMLNMSKDLGAINFIESVFGIRD